MQDVKAYLPLASRFPSIESLTTGQGFPRSPKESITVSTKLCSTKLTQNGKIIRYTFCQCLQKI